MHPLIRPIVERLGADVDLGKAENMAIQACCIEIMTAEAGEDLVEQGSSPNSLHLLLEGWACRYVLLADGRRQIPALLLGGDLCDLDALKANRLNFGVATLSPCRVARFSRTALNVAIDQHHSISQMFLALAIAENAILMRWNRALGGQTSLERIAHLFCELVVRSSASSGEIGAPADIDVPLTQCELGDVLGLSTVHVNRMLQELRARKLIQLDAGRLRVLDWTRLASIAEFDAAYLDLAQAGRRPKMRGPVEPAQVMASG